MLEPGDGLGGLLRNPRQATRNYVKTRSMGGMALDVGEFALTFIRAEAGAGTAAGFVGTRGVVSDYLADPAAWRDARRLAMREMKLQLPRVNDRRPLSYLHAGKTYDGPQWTAALAQK